MRDVEAVQLQNILAQINNQIRDRDLVSLYENRIASFLVPRAKNCRNCKAELAGEQQQQVYHHKNDETLCVDCGVLNLHEESQRERQHPASSAMVYIDGSATDDQLRIDRDLILNEGLIFTKEERADIGIQKVVVCKCCDAKSAPIRWTCLCCRNNNQFTKKGVFEICHECFKRLVLARRDGVQSERWKQAVTEFSKDNHLVIHPMLKIYCPVRTARNLYI